MGLKNEDFYRATSIDSCPFSVKYLLIPEVRQFMYEHFLGWMGEGTEMYANMYGPDLAARFADPDIDVSRCSFFNFF